jgi:hypothetical protein
MARPTASRPIARAPMAPALTVAARRRQRQGEPLGAVPLHAPAGRGDALNGYAWGVCGCSRKSQPVRTPAGSSLKDPHFMGGQRQCQSARLVWRRALSTGGSPAPPPLRGSPHPAAPGHGGRRIGRPRTALPHSDSGEPLWAEPTAPRLRQRVGWRWPPTLSRGSALARQDGRLRRHRGQILRRPDGRLGRRHRWRIRHHRHPRPIASPALGASRLPGFLEPVGGLAADLIKSSHGPLCNALDLRPVHQPSGRIADLLVALSAGFGAEHETGGTADGHAELSSPSPSAGTRPKPPANPPGRLPGRLDAGPRPPAALHGTGYRQ